MLLLDKELGEQLGLYWCISYLSNDLTHSHIILNAVWAPLAAPRLPVLLFLFLDKDLLKLVERLVPCLRQGSQGKGCSKQKGALVEKEYALDSDQAGQIGNA